MKTIFCVYYFLFEDTESYDNGLTRDEVLDLLDQCSMPYREEVARFDTLAHAREYIKGLTPESYRIMYGNWCKGTEFHVYTIEESVLTDDGQDIEEVVGNWDILAESLMTRAEQEEQTREWLEELKYEARHGDEWALMALSDYYDQFDEVPEYTSEEKEQMRIQEEQTRIRNETIDLIKYYFDDDTDSDVESVTYGTVGVYYM